MTGTLSVVALGAVHRGHLEVAAAGAASLFDLVTVIDPPLAEPNYAFNPGRKQFNAASIVRKLGQVHLKPGRDAILAVGEVDLFEPEADFVLGHGDMDFKSAVIALPRIRTGSEDERLSRRLRLLSAWAVGHAIGLRDCDDGRCMMNPPESAFDLDRRGGTLCNPCRALLGKNGKL